MLNDQSTGKSSEIYLLDDEVRIYFYVTIIKTVKVQNSNISKRENNGNTDNNIPSSFLAPCQTVNSLPKTDG